MSNPLLAVIKNGKIEPLDPIDFPEGTQLVVTPLPPNSETENLSDWLNVSRQGLEQAYEDEEPEYSLDLVKEANPDYERRQSDPDPHSPS
jgi:hypothetical protein